MKPRIERERERRPGRDGAEDTVPQGRVEPSVSPVLIATCDLQQHATCDTESEFLLGRELGIGNWELGDVKFSLRYWLFEVRHLFLLIDDR